MKDESEKKLCDYLEVNIGTHEEPRLIKVGKTTPIDERNEIIKLLKEYRDVLAFSYDELKVYREDVIQHVIPLKEETKPFRQKLRQLNPKLAPLVQQELQKMLEAVIIARLGILLGVQTWLLLGRRLEKSGYVLTLGI